MKSELAAGDFRVSTMVVNGFKILCTHGKPGDIIILLQLHGDIPDNIFYKFGVCKTFFRDMLFIDPFQDGIDIARCCLFNELDHIFQPDEFVKPCTETDFTPLVVSTDITDLLRAWTNRRYGNDDFGYKIDLAFRVTDTDNSAGLVHQPHGFAYRGFFFDKIRERDIHMRRCCVEVPFHLFQNH